MHKAWSVLACALALADASQKYPQRVRRDGPYTYSNGTISNSTISRSTTLNTTLSIPPTTTPVTTPLFFSNITSYQNTSATTTTSQESCLGSVTYYDSVPPTVYATVTESFIVTVSASNASLPPAIIVTPPVACIATVIPIDATSSDPPCVAGVCWPASAAATSTALTFQPALTIVTVSAVPQATQITRTSIAPEAATTEGPPPPPPATGSAFTSTVLVTKKTPVPVVVPPTSNPPVFQIPSPTKTPTTTTSPKGDAQPVPSPNVNSKAPPAPVQSPTTTSIGNIINSIINNPFTPISSDAGKVPASTTIDNVPVQVLPSSVVIGGQVVSIPAPSSKTTLEVNGQTFTVQNSQIIAPGTTYAITAARNQEGSPTAAPSPVTAGGLTFSVGASQAIISGTTYAIGNGAGSTTTVRVGTKTVVIGSSGVILPATTVAPEEITAAPLAPEVVTAAGLTFTVGPSYAIISGSTYTIGPGAKSTSVVVGGKTIAIGSSGIGLSSTTIAPEPNFSVITVGTLTFSIDSTEAILRGTTYKIGKGAPTETTMVGAKTISIGPSGVGLQSTTIPPETGPTATGVLQGDGALLLISSYCVISALLAGCGLLFL